MLTHLFIIVGADPVNIIMRKLSGYESAIVYRTMRDIYYNFIIASEYNIHLSVDIIQLILAKICNKYPHFSLYIDTSTVLPTVSYLPSWNVITEDIIDLVSGPVSDVFSQYTLHKFDYSVPKPLWRIAFDQTKNIVYFITDHTFFDGTAGKNFHKEFSYYLSSLTDIELGLKSSVPSTSSLSLFDIDTTHFETFPDPTDLMNFASITDQPNVSTVVAKNTLLPTISQQITQNSPLPLHNSTLYHISNTDVNILLTKSRTIGVKLTSFLYAICSKSLIQVIYDDCNGDNDKFSNTAFKTMIPVNTRPLAISHHKNNNDTVATTNNGSDISGNSINDILEFGLFFGKYFHSDDPNFLLINSLNDIAQNVHKNLHNNISNAMNDYQNIEIQCKKDNTIIDQAMQKLYNRNITPLTTLVMSNLGTLSSDQINNVFFDQPMVDACFGTHFIGCSNGGITLNFTAHRAVVYDQYQQFISNVKKYLAIVLQE